jgi:endo-alpha-1,4-polygalactosaminidase (GH114 family)
MQLEKGKHLHMPTRRFSKWLVGAGTILIILALALGIGLGVGLKHSNDSNSSDDSGDNENDTSLAVLANTTGDWWSPASGATFQVVLQGSINFSNPASIYDIDVFDNNATVMEKLHSMNRSVICYFSAGTYENWRSDKGLFNKSDYAKALPDWPGEYWLNTSSQNVRDIMASRIEMAQTKGCDGVDPDNIDGYDNDTGLNLTKADSIDYLAFLAGEAHARNMSIGLKNGGAIVSHVIGAMQWDINEQCEQYDECDLFQPFIAEDKPVFHIEYPSSSPKITTKQKTKICDNTSADGFSTIMKSPSGLTDWVDACDY